MLVFRARPPRTRSVLLVEVLEPLRTVLQTILEKAGHLVLFAEKSEKAPGSPARTWGQSICCSHTCAFMEDRGQNWRLFFALISRKWPPCICRRVLSK